MGSCLQDQPYINSTILSTLATHTCKVIVALDEIYCIDIIMMTHHWITHPVPVSTLGLIKFPVMWAIVISVILVLMLRSPVLMDDPLWNVRVMVGLAPAV